MAHYELVSSSNPTSTVFPAISMLDYDFDDFSSALYYWESFYLTTALSERRFRMIPGPSLFLARYPIHEAPNR